MIFTVRIIVDSTADLLPEIKRQVICVPLTVNFGDKEYIDGVTITHKEFYEKLTTTDVLPTTSQASPAAFEAIFSKITKEGDEAVVLTLASNLSGTYQSALIAAEGYDNIHIVDTRTVAIGAGILVELALTLLDSGISAVQLAACLEEEKKKIIIVAMVDTLEYLHRGGRISKTVALAGGFLNIKPVMSIADGEIKMLGKARGSKQGNNLLVTEIQKAGGVNFCKPILLGFTGLDDTLLKKYIEDSASLWEQSGQTMRYTQIGSVIGTHAGPGAIAVAFFKN